MTWPANARRFRPIVALLLAAALGMTACGDNLLDQNVDVLISMVVESAIIARSLARARQSGVTTMSVGINITPTDKFDVQYGLDERALSAKLNDYVLEPNLSISRPR